MIKNWYKEYSLARTAKEQEQRLKNRLKNDRKMLEASQKMLGIQRSRLAKIESDESLSDSEKRKEIIKIQSLIEGEEYQIVLKGHIVSTIENALLQDDDREDDGKSRDERIADTYLLLEYQKLLEIITRKEFSTRGISDPDLRDKAIAEVESARRALDSMFRVLGQADTRENYNRELERQEYLESLERDRLARLAASRTYVKGVLGEEFDPNMSKLGIGLERKFDRLSQNDVVPFAWTVDFYDKPEKLFIGESNYPETPQINKKIYAYRYGTFSISSLFQEDGKPTYKDDTSEIIGVTRVGENGEESTDFLIASLANQLEIKDVTPEELEELIKSNVRPLVFQTPEERELQDREREILSRISKRQSKQMREDETEERGGLFHGLKTAMKSVAKSAHSFFKEDADEAYDTPKAESKPGATSDIIDLQRYTRQRNATEKANILISSMPQEKIHVLIPKVVRHQISPDESEFFANVFLSDYLINNAVENNANYLGTYEFSKGKQSVSYTGPMEAERIQACFFAKKNPGKIRMLTKPNSNSKEINGAVDLDSLFYYLRRMQRQLVTVEQKKTSRKKAVPDRNEQQK